MTTNPEHQPNSPYPPASPYPSGQPTPGYPQPQGPTYGQGVPYEQGPAYQGGFPAQSPFAHWGKRVGAYLLDGFLIGIVPFILGMVALATGESVTTSSGTTVNPSPAGGVMLFVATVLYFGLWIWNRLIRQGKTGQSVGKKVLGIRLIGRATGQPVGAGVALLREICHIVDGFFYLGYLWPLWDRERQTFSDKIVGTYVVNV